MCVCVCARVCVFCVLCLFVCVRAYGARMCVFVVEHAQARVHVYVCARVSVLARMSTCAFTCMSHMRYSTCLAPYNDPLLIINLLPTVLLD